MPSAVPRVHFATTASASRPARDDEIYVMERFAGHASHCRTCSHPYKSFTSGKSLCERGQVYAKDVSQYVYCKGGKPYSVIDRKDSEQRVQIEIPRSCDVIDDLLKAVDKGMRLPKNKPVITHESYHNADLIERQPSTSPSSSPRRRNAVSGPSSSSNNKRDSGIFITGRGSLYRRDEADRKLRDYDEDPIIIRASPGVRVREYHR